MKTCAQIGRGVANFFDEEVRPSLPSGKAILYGLVVARAAQKMEDIIKAFAGPLAMLGVVDDTGGIDVEALAAELKKQMEKNGGQLIVTIGKDEFVFRPREVDALMEYINREG